MLGNFLDGRKSSREKSNFAQTCNLLSQYLKGKGNLRDLNLGITGKLEASGRTETSTATTTLPLTADADESGQIATQHVNLFRKSVTMGSYTSIQDVITPIPGPVQERRINYTTHLQHLPRNSLISTYNHRGQLPSYLRQLPTCQADDLKYNFFFRRIK